VFHQDSFDVQAFEATIQARDITSQTIHDVGIDSLANAMHNNI
jgi:hypothetical protein